MLDFTRFVVIPISVKALVPSMTFLTDSAEFFLIMVHPVASLLLLDLPPDIYTRSPINSSFYK